MVFVFFIITNKSVSNKWQNYKSQNISVLTVFFFNKVSNRNDFITNTSNKQYRAIFYVNGCDTAF